MATANIAPIFNIRLSIWRYSYRNNNIFATLISTIGFNVLSGFSLNFQHFLNLNFKGYQDFYIVNQSP